MGIFGDKPFWKSKAFYGAVLIFIAGGLNALGYDASWLYGLGGALSIIGIRTAKN